MALQKTTRVEPELGGINSVTYEWGLGETSNNRVEAYGLLMGTKILKNKDIKDPIIMGDSTIIIEAMINKRTPPNGAMSETQNKIRQNLVDLENVTIKHILQENNRTYDHHENVAVAIT